MGDTQRSVGRKNTYKVQHTVTEHGITSQKMSQHRNMKWHNSLQLVGPFYLHIFR